MEKQNLEEIKRIRESEAHDPKNQDISYRDKLSTVDTDGKRVYLKPRIPKGKFIFWRNVVGVFLLFLLFAMPLIKINGEPLMMINLIERKFIIFGIIFWPQDTFILLLMMLSFLVFILLFTVTYGRIFCGWLCPQTIFLEIVFRRIESWFEGSPAKQKKLDAQPWNGEKILKRGTKWIVFYILSFVFVNVIIWYFMSFDKWMRYAGEMDKHIAGIIVIFVFTTVFFGIYSWFREQICLIVCPYGRMQGVLIEPSTIVISYDYLRGEPRGHQKKGSTRETTGLGDCVDCHACVDVCPTGIDIRNGTQLECVNCTACIDACDNVMDTFGKPKGLIRYASEKEIATGKKVGFSLRIGAYSAILLGLIIFFVSMLFTRADVEAVILRTPGVLYQQAGPDSISNLYNIKAVNKTRFEQKIGVSIDDLPGQVKIIGGDLVVPPEGKVESDITDSHFKYNLNILIDGKIKDKSKVTFIAPNK